VFSINFSIQTLKNFSQVPSENWYNFASQIEDRQLSGNLKSFHDEHREITLGKMEIIPPRPNVPSDRPMVELAGRYRYDEYAMDLPDCSMPKNIKNFDVLTLKFDFYI
jgi:hypothetical protein